MIKEEVVDSSDSLHIEVFIDLLAAMIGRGTGSILFKSKELGAIFCSSHPSNKRT